MRSLPKERYPLISFASCWSALNSFRVWGSCRDWCLRRDPSMNLEESLIGSFSVGFLYTLREPVQSASDQSVPRAPCNPGIV
jgi:hypothetical protein